MFSISKLGGGIGADYYINDLGAMDPPGRWVAAGNSLPWVENWAVVDKETWRALLSGFNPTTGESLVNGADEKHMAGIDLTFADPNSISSIWAVAPPELRQKIEEAHEKAVLAAMEFAAENAAYTRQGKGEAIAEKLPGLVYGKFNHGTSRELDPQVHDHCVVPNAQRRSDGTFVAIETKFIYQWHSAIAGVFHTEHARLLNRIGLKTIVDPRTGLFEVEGVPELVTEGWSKRTQQIKSTAGVVGIETRVARAEISRAELLQRWESEGKALGWDADQAAALVA